MVEYIENYLTAVKQERETFEDIMEVQKMRSDGLDEAQTKLLNEQRGKHTE